MLYSIISNVRLVKEEPLRWTNSFKKRSLKTTWCVSSVRLGAWEDHFQHEKTIWERAFYFEKDTSRMWRALEKHYCSTCWESWSSFDLGDHEAYYWDPQLRKDSQRWVGLAQVKIRRNPSHSTNRALFKVRLY